MNLKELEHIFRTSNSPNELFDAFQLAIKAKLKDEELYKTLLWNKALSIDEVSMYAEKICSEFPELCYNIYFWTAQIFESISNYGDYCEHAFKYFIKSSESNKNKSEPYLRACLLYNSEIKMPDINHIVEFVRSGIEHAEVKSILCFALADLFHTTGEINLMQSYKNLGDKYLKEGM